MVGFTPNPAPWYWTLSGGDQWASEPLSWINIKDPGVYTEECPSQLLSEWLRQVKSSIGEEEVETSWKDKPLVCATAKKSLTSRSLINGKKWLVWKRLQALITDAQEEILQEWLVHQTGPRLQGVQRRDVGCRQVRHTWSWGWAIWHKNKISSVFKPNLIFDFKQFFPFLSSKHIKLSKKTILNVKLLHVKYVYIYLFIYEWQQRK